MKGILKNGYLRWIDCVNGRVTEVVNVGGKKAEKGGRMNEERIDDKAQMSCISECVLNGMK